MRQIGEWLSRYVVRVELVLLILILMTVYLKSTTSGLDGVLIILLFTLATLYFLCAYAPTTDVGSLPAMIGIKVHYIASSVCVIGATYTILHWPGAEQMFTIGGTSVGVAGVILLVTWISKRNMALLPMVMRSIFYAVIAYLHVIPLQQVNDH